MKKIIILLSMLVLSNLGYSLTADEIIRKNFNDLGMQGIFDKGILPDFSLTEIRARCQAIGLIDEYGNRKRN